MQKELIYMTREIDFYFDFISPYTYLAYKKIQSLPENIKINYKPILLGGLHNLEGITAPAFIKPKLKHMISDCYLIAKKSNIDFLWNSRFPLNSLNIMRGYIFVKPNIKDLYLKVIFDAYWKDNLDISNKKIVMFLLGKCKINISKFFESIRDPKIKDILKFSTKEAHDKDIFGAPTFIVNDKIFWGQDRLEFALDELKK